MKSASRWRRTTALKDRAVGRRLVDTTPHHGCLGLLALPEPPVEKRRTFEAELLPALLLDAMTTEG